MITSICELAFLYFACMVKSLPKLQKNIWFWAVYVHIVAQSLMLPIIMMMSIGILDYEYECHEEGSYLLSVVWVLTIYTWMAGLGLHMLKLGTYSVIFQIIAWCQTSSLKDLNYDLGCLPLGLTVVMDF